LERHLVVLAAVVTDDLETLWRILGDCGFFRAAFGAPLRRHHISLVKHLLIFFREHKDVLTLNTRNFYVRHFFSS